MDLERTRRGGPDGPGGGGPLASHGSAVWSSPAWHDEATAWLDERLADAGIGRTGEVEQPHLRPWATVLRVPTTTGPVWMKAAGPGTAFEVGLGQLLAKIVPDRVLAPIAVDAPRGWMLLPDGGASLGQRLTGTELVDAVAAALARYGVLQQAMAPHVDQLLALGVADMRPAVMPERFAQALDVTATSIERHGTSADRAMHRRVAAMVTTVAGWCDQLAASALLPSIDHNDLHPWNILGDGGDGARFYDWGDSVVAAPFAAMLVPLGLVRHHLGADLDDPRFLAARDAYLEVFTEAAPGDDLVATLEVACRVAKIARVLTWDRALRAAQDQGEEIDVQFARAPVETLASLLDHSYLGGA